MRQTEIDKVCPECGKAFKALDKRKVYCTRSCAATRNNKNRGNKPMVKCLNSCGKMLQAGRTYCSTFCEHFHHLAAWQQGEWTPTSLEFPRWLREWVIGWGCSICRWKEKNPVTGKIPVQIDHINGDSSDHSFANIRALCPNCHSLTPNYGALNKGNGRKHRRKSAVV
ncbi:HNH endonuclease [Streptomyces phage Spilled]|nr:HNH endonuclease [Streptomyces phage Wipeout]QGH79018.1 HNH endonuclease [Streptomyces phage TomSawyer]UVK60029.1 HNH endonuclease [Streptomyces phage Spilled]WGH19921.1 HNH endonuclease [Streptomyces phage PumpkinSpice]